MLLTEQHGINIANKSITFLISKNIVKKGYCQKIIMVPFMVTQWIPSCKNAIKKSIK